MNPSFEFDEVEHFTAGTLGPKGQRVFYLQTRSDGVLVTVKVEKQQVSALAEYLDSVLEELPDSGDVEQPTMMDLLEPVQPVWVVAQMAVAYDGDDDRIVLMLEELVASDFDDDFEDFDPDADLADDLDDDLDDDIADIDDGIGEFGDGTEVEPATLRVRLTRGQTRALIERARGLVAAGRPPCRFCGRPLDGSDDWCPCWN